MAENVVLNPGLGGDIAAADEIAGVKYQRIKLTLGVDGVNDGDVSSGNPVPVAAYGELIEAIEAMRIATQSLTRTMGQMLPDTAARMRVNVETGTLSTVGTLTALTSLINQVQIGGLAATEHVPSLMRLGADSARRNITTS